MNSIDRGLFNKPPFRAGSFYHHSLPHHTPMKHQCNICKQEAVYKEDGIYYCKECIEENDKENFEEIKEEEHEI